MNPINHDKQSEWPPKPDTCDGWDEFLLAHEHDRPLPLFMVHKLLPKFLRDEHSEDVLTRLHLISELQRMTKMTTEECLVIVDDFSVRHSIYVPPKPSRLKKAAINMFVVYIFVYALVLMLMVAAILVHIAPQAFTHVLSPQEIKLWNQASGKLNPVMWFAMIPLYIGIIARAIMARKRRISKQSAV